MPKINDETLFDVVAVFIAADAIHSRWLWQVLLQNYDLLVKYIFLPGTYFGFNSVATLGKK